MVLKGTLVIRLRDRDLAIHEGEFAIIPRGVEHLPVAEEEVHVLLEPKSTLNTGNVQNERTVQADLRAAALLLAAWGIFKTGDA